VISQDVSEPTVLVAAWNIRTHKSVIIETEIVANVSPCRLTIYTMLTCLSGIYARVTFGHVLIQRGCLSPG